MCQDCDKEYNNPSDRRFHAQPNACPVCGPWITLTKANEMSKIHKQCTDNHNIMRKAQELLDSGKILAIRSIGGFLLACDARNDKAVQILRKRKRRLAKPFAIMCKDIRTIKRICEINSQEIRILKSQIAPIVLLKKKQNIKKGILSDLIAPNNGYLGVMLPYTPLHKLLFNVSRETYGKRLVVRNWGLDTLVMTSANPKNSPIIANSNEIRQKLSGVVDYILDHNRPIESRCDDSIVFNYAGPVIIRYSRGYVPEPIYLQNINLKPVLAFGSDLKNSFALGQGNKVYVSPYIGELVSEDSIKFLFEMLERYQKWFGIKPEVIACDLHPDYISRRIAEEYAKKHGLELIKVQHHYAHLAGVMAEYSIAKPVIGVGYDGTGYGTDSNIWGSEIMVLDYNKYERVSHLNYLLLIGGDVAITNPWLVAKGYLEELGLSRKTAKRTQSKNEILTSSMGRLFDAVSAILGLCKYQTFEGQAPSALEAEAMKATYRNSKFQIPNSKFYKDGLIDPKPILEEVLTMKKQRISTPEIALHFHNRIVQVTIDSVKEISDQHKIKTVCLSGGVFQNRIILNGVYLGLARAGFKVFINRTVPINDGGIAFGQAVIAGLSPR
jgi:hydrogenase maturation protein HypF